MIPEILIKSLQNVIGFDEKAFLEIHKSNNQIVSVRTNNAKSSDNTIDLVSNLSNGKVPWCSEGFYLKERPYFTHDPMLHCGAYYVQEASSMFLKHVLKEQIKENANKIVLDLCAAPGGKSTLLASYFKNGMLVSNEVIKTRVNILTENITKWGADNVVVTNNDASHFEVLENFFDVIVVDAPCSGSGLFRKDKYAIKEWSSDNVNLCSQRQQRILSNIANCLKPDGILIYSTCSYSKQENEDIVDWFQNEYQFQTLKVNVAKEWGIVETETLANNYGYRFYPDKVKGEGFFISVFKNNSSEIGKQKFKTANLQKLTKQEIEVLGKIIKHNADLFYFKHNENVKIFPLQWKHELEIVSNYLYIKKAGVELGSFKAKDFVPSHELAMSCLEFENVNKVGVNKQIALQYLSKKEVIIDTPLEGWILLVYENVALGWIKKMKNRINNYYPTEWRILNTEF